MAKESINEVIERVKAETEDARLANAHGFGLKVADVAALIAELETVRAERDALRTALKDVRIQAEGNGVEPMDMPEALNWIVQRAAAALNTQPAPQAEWTPRVTYTEPIFEVGQTVKRTSDGWEGFISKIDLHPLVVDPRYVTSWDTLRAFQPTELEANLAPDPYLGKRVKTSDTSFPLINRGEIGTVYAVKFQPEHEDKRICYVYFSEHGLDAGYVPSELTLID